MRLTFHWAHLKWAEVKLHLLFQEHLQEQGLQIYNQQFYGVENLQLPPPGFRLMLLVYNVW